MKATLEYGSLLGADLAVPVERTGVLGRVLLLLLVCAGLGGLGYGAWYYRLRPIPPLPSPLLPAVVMEGATPMVKMPNGNLLALVGSYDGELRAYLRLQYLQGLPVFAGIPVLMTTREVDEHPEYRLYAVMHNDLIGESTRLARIQIAGFIPGFDTLSPARPQIDAWARQDALFRAAYAKPVIKELLEFPKETLTSSVAAFILFKVRTDRRVREQIEPAYGVVLSPEQSRAFAADMIDVAQFYQLPLPLLLGVGAMENNYLDVRGDLQHAVWKRHRQRGDLILARKRGRYLVSNFSLGPWQITRETLRAAHELFLKDGRDYNTLPARLRPPRKLDLNNVDPPVLTTYAGIILRQLLDYFDGDIDKAAGAYNGGPGNPNEKYAAGVDQVATYARRVLGLAVERKEAALARTAALTRATALRGQ